MAEKKKVDSEETTPVEEVKGEKSEEKQRLPIEEFSIMKGIMRNYFGAFRLYCQRNPKLLIPKPFEEWNEVFEEFKKLS